MTDEDLELALTREHAAAFAWALRCCGGAREEAEDALHAAYERILDGRARFRRESSFRTWLFGVVRRTALEQRRRDWLRLTRLRHWFVWTAPLDPAADPGGSLEERERVEWLRSALSRLSRRQQQMLHLVFYQELSVQEAAQVLGSDRHGAHPLRAGEAPAAHAAWGERLAMIEPGSEQEIRAAFQALRAVEQRQVPEYHRIVVGRADLPHRSRKVAWLVLAGSAVMLAAGLLLGPRRAPIPDAAFSGSWKSPTASLLPTSVAPLLGFTPQPGVAVPGSPLRALDPGGPLGPLLGRSPRL